MSRSLTNAELEVRAVKLGGAGIWNAGLAFGDPGEIAEAADELSELGYTSIWFPGYGTGVFEAAERLLLACPPMTIGTGIRVKAHRDAGADSVCVQVLSEGGMVAMARAVWRDLAPALTSL